MTKHVEIRKPNDRYTPDQLAELAKANDAYQAEYYRHGSRIEAGVGWLCACGWTPKADAVSTWRSTNAHVKAARRKANIVFRQASSAALRPASSPGTVETERHDYEPGEGTHPMHTDPMCRVCGQPERSHH